MEKLKNPYLALSKEELEHKYNSVDSFMDTLRDEKRELRCALELHEHLEYILSKYIEGEPDSHNLLNKVHKALSDTIDSINYMTYCMLPREVIIELLQEVIKTL